MANIKQSVKNKAKKGQILKLIGEIKVKFNEPWGFF